MTAAQLAALVLQVLDVQRAYFCAKPGPEKGELLRECKGRESHLRKVCGEILEPAKTKPGLFDNPPEVKPARMPD